MPSTPDPDQGPVPIVGQRAPDFTLRTTSGRDVSLSVLQGQKVLLAFFPLAFTSVCTTEMCAFNDDYDTFARAGVVVLPISVDSTACLKEFRAKYGLKTELVSDFRRDVSRAYGVLNEEWFFANRAYFLLDEQGIVRWAHVEEQSRMRRDNAEILAHIAALG
jgi:peroxiredoxin